MTLETVPTEVLIGELLNRSEAAAVLLTRPASPDDDGEVGFASLHHFSGNLHTVLGLLVDAQRMVQLGI